MKYCEILEQLAIKENKPKNEIEREMKAALNYAGINCSVEDFIEITAKTINKKTIYSMNV